MTEDDDFQVDTAVVEIVNQGKTMYDKLTELVSCWSAGGMSCKFAEDVRRLLSGQGYKGYAGWLCGYKNPKTRAKLGAALLHNLACYFAEVVASAPHNEEALRIRALAHTEFGHAWDEIPVLKWKKGDRVQVVAKGVYKDKFGTVDTVNPADTPAGTLWVRVDLFHGVMQCTAKDLIPTNMESPMPKWNPGDHVYLTSPETDEGRLCMVVNNRADGLVELKGWANNKAYFREPHQLTLAKRAHDFKLDDRVWIKDPEFKNRPARVVYLGNNIVIVEFDNNYRYTCSKDLLLPIDHPEQPPKEEDLIEFKVGDRVRFTGSSMYTNQLGVVTTEPNQYGGLHVLRDGTSNPVPGNICRLTHNLEVPTQQEQQIMTNAPAIENKTFVFGTDISKMTDDDLYGAITTIGAEIERLSKVSPKPKKLEAKIAELQDQQQKIAELVDSRS